jgi:hypothetical protein
LLPGFTVPFEPVVEVSTELEDVVVVVLEEVVVSVTETPVPRPDPVALAFALRLTFTPPNDKFIFKLTFSSGIVPVVVVVVVVFEV